MYYMLDLNKHLSQTKYFVLRWLGEQYGFGYLHSIDGEASFNVSITSEVSQFQLLWASVFFHPQIYL